MADHDAIVRVALDYFEGSFDGDAARIERTLHPDLAKRSPDDAPALGELEKHGAGDDRGDGEGDREDARRP